MNGSYVEYRIDNIRDRRELLKYITTISLAILGLSSFILEKSLQPSFTILALFIHTLLIFLVVFYFREIIDLEGLELIKQQDRYNTLSNDALEIADRYIDQRIFSAEAYANFWKELKESEGAKDLEEEVNKLNGESKNRILNLDYFGELIGFLLICATIFMILGSIEYIVNIYTLGFVLLFIFTLSFSDFVLRLSKNISSIISFLKKERRGPVQMLKKFFIKNK